MYHYDRGLKLTELDLALDFTRRQARGFISHAHSDHMARHELAYCTPETARLYQHRLGKQRVVEMPYRQPRTVGNTRLTTYPAGHILGSAMLLAEVRGRSLLYTGDFKLGPSLTATPAEVPQADILVMESTYGDPAYRLPPWGQSCAELVRVVRETLEDGVTPVVHAYVLGKAQEVTRILTTAGIGVLQHADAFAISRIYQACGVELGNVREYAGKAEPGCAVVTPPPHQKGFRVPGLKRVRSIAVTGWAMQGKRGFFGKVDYAIPLSDHADFNELIACAERVSPKVVLCTHGPQSFVGELRSRGFHAHRLEDCREASRLLDAR